MKGGITKLRDDVSRRLEDKVKKVGNMSAFLNRVIYQEYRMIQIERWDSENRSEGHQWSRYRDKAYASIKRRRFAGYPYAGEKMGVATGDLLKSAVGPSPKHRKIVKKSSLVVSTSVPYAQYFDENRTISALSKRTVSRLRDMVKEYVRG